MLRDLVKILMLESNAEDARMIQEVISTVTSEEVALTHVASLQDAISHLAHHQYDVILMNLFVVDSNGYATFAHIKQHATRIPIVVLTERNDDALAVQVVKNGAEDYLVKSYLEHGKRTVSPPLLVRSIRYAVDRHRMQSELKRYTEEIEAKERRFRTIIDKNADGIVIIDKQGVIQFVNPTAEIIFDRSADYLLGESLGFPVMGGETTEIEVLRQEGNHATAEMRVVEIEWEQSIAYLATFRDITERKRGEKRRLIRYTVTSILTNSDSIYEAIPHLLQNICEGSMWDIGEMWLEDYDTHNLEWCGIWHAPNIVLPDYQEISRTSETTQELPAQVWRQGEARWITDIPNHPHLHHAYHFATPHMQTGCGFPIINGRKTIGVLVLFSRLPLEQRRAILRLMQDIGIQIGQFIARKRAEDELRNAHRALRTLNECNQSLIHATEEHAFLHDICRIIVEVGGYRMAWAGFAEQEEQEHVSIVAKAAYQNETIHSFDVSWASSVSSTQHGPTRKAIETGIPCVAKNIRRSTKHLRWQDYTALNGVVASVALPLITDNHTFGVLNIYAEEPDAFGKEEVKLLMEMANDLAYGIMALRTRSERDQAERALRLYAERLKNMHEIDQAILTAQTPEAIAQAALSHIRRVVPYQWASIIGYNMEENKPVTLVADIKGNDTDPTFALPGSRIPLLSPEIQHMSHYATAHYEGDIQRLSLPERTPLIEELLVFGIRSYINAPLIADNQPIGNINLGTTTPYAFNEQHLSIIHEVADQMAVAINHARLFEQVRAGSERLQKLSRRLMEVQEMERHHIARELHDEIGQSLTAVKISLQAIQRVPEAAPLAPALKESMAIVDQTLEQVRNLSLDLRPSLLDDLGLEAALRWYIDRQSQWTGFKVEFVTDLFVPRLPPDLETACFRVTQEALTNIIRHAKASWVYVELQQDDEALHLFIQDNGIGFDVHAAQERATRGSSLGLLGMQERVLFADGQIEIQSSPGNGTEIQARFPLQAYQSHPGSTQRYE